MNFNEAAITGLAMVGIVAIVLVAVANGINGVVMATGMTLLGGLGGYEVGRRKRPK